MHNFKALLLVLLALGFSSQLFAAANVEAILQVEQNGKKVQDLPVSLTDISYLKMDEETGCYTHKYEGGVGYPESRLLTSANQDGKYIFEDIPSGTYVLRYSLLRPKDVCGEIVIDVRADFVRPDVNLGPFLLNVYIEKKK